MRNQDSGQGEEKQSWFAPAALTTGEELTTCHFQLHMKPMSGSLGVKSSCQPLATFFPDPGTTGIAAVHGPRKCLPQTLVLSFGNLELY